MGERDQVWEHRENLFPGFKCKYCLKEFRGVELQGGRSIWRGKLGMLYGALNAHQIYGTTSYMSCKGSKSERRPYMMKGSIECKAQFQNPMMKIRNYRRC
jgi:hypothetical protein